MFCDLIQWQLLNLFTDMCSLSYVHLYRIEYVLYRQGPYRIRIASAADRIVPALNFTGIILGWFPIGYRRCSMGFCYLRKYVSWSETRTRKEHFCVKPYNILDMERSTRHWTTFMLMDLSTEKKVYITRLHKGIDPLFTHLQSETCYLVGFI